MISLCPGHNCDEARVYYYELIAGTDQDQIPNPVRQHVDHCEECQQQILRLEHLLAEMEDQPSDQLDTLMTHLLGLHFGYLNQEVTCAAAKPFLPTLVDSTLVIRVTTPITQHVAHCEDCQLDIKKIESLGLTSRQLYRFGQFLAEAQSDKAPPFVASWVDQIAEFRDQDLTAEMRKQVCLSREARARLFTARATLLESLGKHSSAQDLIPCDQVDSADLFDFALPYGTNPANDENQRFTQVFADHVRQCRFCLERVQVMHQHLFQIVEREDTRVVTVLRLGSEQAKESQNEVTETRQIQRKHNVRPVIVPLVRSFAALLLLVLAFFLLTRQPSAVAVEYEEMHAALADVEGLHITHWNPGAVAVNFTMRDARTQSIRQEIFVDLVHERWLMHQGGTLVLWDLSEQQQLTAPKGGAEVIRRTIPEEMLPGLRAQLQGFFNVLPGSGHMPAGAQWAALDEQLSAEGWEIRELRIPQQSPNGQERWHKSVYYLDPVTRLPQRVEFYRAARSTDEAELRTITTVTYPSTEELAAAMAIFPRQTSKLMSFLDRIK